MSDLRDAMGPGVLEPALVDLGTAIDWPGTPDLTAGIRSRMVAEPTRPVAGHRPVVRSLRRSLLLAAALALLVVGAALAVRVGLDLLRIEFGPAPTAAPSSGAGGAGPATPAGSRRPSPAPTAASTAAATAAAPDRVGLHLGLGAMVTLDEARQTTPFRILVPEALGPPDAVFMGGDPLRGQISLVYAAGPGHPPLALLAGGGVLVTENRGRLDEGLVHKLVDASVGTATRVDVAGRPGYWLAGAPHGFWYVAADGTNIGASGRLVGDTLAWEDGDMLYRIEGARDLDDALAIAASMR